MTRFVIIFSIFISQPILAKEKLLCASYYAYKYKKHVDNFSSDKLKHCTLSCMIAKRCSLSSTAALGLFKEISDIFTPGDAEWADLKANAKGIQLSFKTYTPYGCKKLCRNFY